MAKKKKRSTKHKVQCDPVVYAFESCKRNKKGVTICKIVRVGQSNCVQRREHEVRRGPHSACVRRAHLVVLERIPNRTARLRAERQWIDLFKPKCNPVRR
ncbi:MAG: hypothetical protein IT378_23985 [Sandaracinaceae bacterium]|nr:hypothetical protein [Sandaracinaceae bacterium]